MAGFKTTYITKLTDVDTTDKEGVGTLRWEGGKCYKYVKFVDASDTAVVGDGLGYVADAYPENTVCADITDMDAQCIPAGVAVAAITATNSWAWIQIKGLVVVAAAFNGTTPAQGDTLFLLTTDKTFTVDPTVNTRAAGILSHVANKEMILDCPF